jgi:hypothetical protein
MAEATEEMEGTAASQLRATYAEIAGLLLTVIFTAWAAKAARAADAAVSVTREIGKKQTRAYLTIRRIKVIKFEPNSPVEVSIRIENAGQTPATDISAIGFLPFGFSNKKDEITLCEEWAEQLKL